MVEELALGARDLYAQAEERLLGIIARQLARGLDAPGWVERKLEAVQVVRRASQAVADELGRATQLEVFDFVAEAYNTGHRAAVAELGALSDDASRLVDDVTPNPQAVDRLAAEAVNLLTDRHRASLRAVDDGYRAVVAEVTATPLLGTGTRRQQRSVGPDLNHRDPVRRPAARPGTQRAHPRIRPSRQGLLRHRTQASASSCPTDASPATTNATRTAPKGPAASTRSGVPAEHREAHAGDQD
ncbi:phage minor capsid protein [Streptomyces sp. NPDC051913]|uniref:phage minor capsid protein n=1 Tax=Streptomyces sp. NPDC051913 TaxID=3365676 RepID=UPI0037CE4B71